MHDMKCTQDPRNLPLLTPPGCLAATPSRPTAYRGLGCTRAEPSRTLTHTPKISKHIIKYIHDTLLPSYITTHEISLHGRSPPQGSLPLTRTPCQYHTIHTVHHRTMLSTHEYHPMGLIPSWFSPRPRPLPLGRVPQTPALTYTLHPLTNTPFPGR